jgi:purine-binding chemotaxis protein CheW
MSTPATQSTELFGSFVLGSDEFALPASCIREVVNFPDKISALPLSPPFLEGVFTLRGSVIPVVNLGRVFQPDAPCAEKHHKIAILDFKQVLVGILFHSTGEVLRVRPEQRNSLNYANGGKEVIAGTILLEDGKRLIQVLNPTALISIENVPHVTALMAMQAAGGKHQQQSFHSLSQRRRCVSFRVGAASFALEMSAIQEIIRVPELHRSILNSKLCLGRIDFRGSQVGVVEFAELLNGTGGKEVQTGERSFLPDERIVIVRIDDATIGFLVDSVDSIVHFFDDEIMPIPVLGKSRSGMFSGCIANQEAGNVILLDHRQILSQNEIVELRKGHANLYPDETKQAASHSDGIDHKGERKSGRQVYITFALDNTYAVEIKQVREIIDFSDAIASPPGMPKFMRGVLNLRQQMVSVVDLRRLYNLPELESASQSKILIVENGNDCYGLMVDSIENIVTVNDAKRFTAPKLGRRQDAGSDPRSEMDDVIDINDSQDGNARTVSVFECERLLQRLSQECKA